MERIIVGLWSALFFFVLTCSVSWAQATAQVSGTVRDQTGAVQADAALVETRTSSVGQVIENQRILELPLNGRNVTDLITLAGAAVQTGTATGRLFSGTQISVGGSVPTGTDYSLDGANHINFLTGVGLDLPFPDATQEFKVETGGLAANRGSSSAVAAVTKSGTNDFHGDLFE